VNGDLFREQLPFASFTAQMRETLLEACNFNWAKVSPAIFGSLFQSVMDAKERRKKGAHYTTEKNILKVIGPLFLDDLKTEFARLKELKRGRAQALEAFRQSLGKLTFLDPACGCGNFLIIAYRELRELELSVLRVLNPQGQRDIGVTQISALDVDQFYGIESEEFPALIAEVAMWMMDHIMNNQLSLEFGQTFIRIPLKKSPHIKHADALETDWNTLLLARDCSYVLGNPPFIGAKYQSDIQRQQVRNISTLGGSGGTLDYVCAWFLKAGAYINQPSPALRAGEGAQRADEGYPRTKIAFVSTNSITQGEQVAQLWPLLFDRHKLEIAFAHRTFAWGSEARGVAHVHVVIIGLTRADMEPAAKRLFSYDEIKGDPVESQHAALTPYLFNADTVGNRHLVVVGNAAAPNGRNLLLNGSTAADGGHLVFEFAKREEYLQREPKLATLIRPFVGGQDLLNNVWRYCFWLVDCSVQQIKESTILRDTVKAVREMRELSTKAATRDKAGTASLFTERRQPLAGMYLAIPRTSSERRDYIPMSYLEFTIIAANDLQIIPNASPAEFAILSSLMHNSWARVTAGRLESRIRYSAKFTYNTFPWPEMSRDQEAKISALAQAVLDARAAWPNSTLADLYDPDLMPPNLRKAHQILDLAVDRLYRKAAFSSERERVEHLFGLYEKMVAPLEAAAKAKPKRAKKA
jgi:N-6 DNA Methylase